MQEHHTLFVFSAVLAAFVVLQLLSSWSIRRWARSLEPVLGNATLKTSWVFGETLLGGEFDGHGIKVLLRGMNQMVVVIEIACDNAPEFVLYRRKPLLFAWFNKSLNSDSSVLPLGEKRTALLVHPSSRGPMARSRLEERLGSAPLQNALAALLREKVARISGSIDTVSTWSLRNTPRTMTARRLRVICESLVLVTTELVSVPR